MMIQRMNYLTGKKIVIKLSNNNKKCKNVDLKVVLSKTHKDSNKD